MKKWYLPATTSVLICVMTCFLSCQAQTVTPAPQPDSSNIPLPDAQIAEYVVGLFEDQKGNLWFGTIDMGVARYDGHSLTYFTTKDGLVGNTITSIVEDRDGHIWLGSHSGLSKYDGKTFTNFTSTDGLCDNRVANLLIDKAGNFWIGTWKGVCRYNGLTFSSFHVPKPDIQLLSYQNTMNWVTEITEDQNGNIWFGWDGYGAIKYDGANFTHFTKKDGLASNNVQDIKVDHQGHVWFGSRVTENDNPATEGRTGGGGLSRYDGQSVVQFPDIAGLHQNNIYALLTDRKGNLWIGANGLGVYRYDGESFQLFKGTDRMDLTYTFGVQDMLEDRHGNIWFGFSGGLFRLEGDTIKNVTQNMLRQ
jgi:ligand-binding sensor domain-containing protein